MTVQNRLKRKAWYEIILMIIKKAARFRKVCKNTDDNEGLNHNPARDRDPIFLIPFIGLHLNYYKNHV